MPKIEFDEQKHLYTVDGEKMPSVTEILHPLTAKHYGEISKEVLQYAAERGTAVHEVCEDIDNGFTELEIAEEWEGYVDAYWQFLQDYEPEWLGIEEMVYHEGSGYCGRVDRWGILNGKRCVLDIKTTSAPTKANYMAGACQTIAYGNALKNIEKGFLLYLKKDGTYRLVDTVEWAIKHDFDAPTVWQTLLDLYDLTERSVK